MTLHNTQIAVGAITGAAGWAILDAIAFSLFNVKSSTIFMALLGAAFSHAWNTEESVKQESKKKMYFGVIANTLASATLVGLVPHAFALEWYKPELEGSLAFLTAVVSRVVIPLLFKALPGAIPELLRKWFRLGEYNFNHKKRQNDEEAQ